MKGDFMNYDKRTKQKQTTKRVKDCGRPDKTDEGHPDYFQNAFRQS